ncbi:adp-ribosylation factor-related protein [Anaeramoeba flamelloides]|uniref:Adp-ribosylation factor-related protein n=1 Tax=Anaeramoeba flamelloides TaxID=1746091 RepID=A0ABQ8ZA43_9EUKA|nr:adp-ribosylation factor-related protein [Anaeramoeba flamelloides]
MFHLVSGLIDSVFKESKRNFLLLGIDSSGKTTLLEKIKNIYKGSPNKKLNPIYPTIGLNIERFQVKEKNIVMRDLGGEQSLREIWANYYKGTEGIIYVFDSSDLNQQRIEESRQTFEQLVEDEELQDVPILIFANKQDKEQKLSKKDVENIFCDSIPMGGVFAVVECSVHNVEALTKGIEWIVSKIPQEKK